MNRPALHIHSSIDCCRERIVAFRSHWDSVRVFGGSRRAAVRYCWHYVRGNA